jgi:hypothetical protein
MADAREMIRVVVLKSGGPPTSRSDIGPDGAVRQLVAARKSRRPAAVPALIEALRDRV